MKKNALVVVVVLVAVGLGYMLPRKNRTGAADVSRSTAANKPEQGGARPSPVQAHDMAANTDALSGNAAPVRAPAPKREPACGAEGPQTLSGPEGPGAGLSTSLPADNIAWTLEHAMRGVTEANEEVQAGHMKVAMEELGRLAQAARIEITEQEAERLSGVCVDAAVAFCRQWQPVLKEGLAKPGAARDRTLRFGAVDFPIMLRVAAIVGGAKEMTEILGAERYSKVKSAIDPKYFQWYDSLTDNAQRSNSEAVVID